MSIFASLWGVARAICRQLQTTPVRYRLGGQQTDASGAIRKAQLLMCGGDPRTKPAICVKRHSLASPDQLSSNRSAPPAHFLQAGSCYRLTVQGGRCHALRDDDSDPRQNNRVFAAIRKVFRHLHGQKYLEQESKMQDNHSLQVCYKQI